MSWIVYTRCRCLIGGFLVVCAAAVAAVSAPAPTSVPASDPARRASDLGQALERAANLDEAFGTHPVDVYLDGESVVAGKPHLSRARAVTIYYLGETCYVGFSLPGRERPTVRLNVRQIAAVHMTSKMPNRQFERTKEWTERNIALGDDLHRLAHDPTDLYLDAASVRAGRPTLSGLRTSGAHHLGDYLGHFYTDGPGDKSRWLVNMNRVVQVVPRDK